MNLSWPIKCAFALFCLASPEIAQAAPAGTYVRSGSSARTSAFIVIHDASSSSVTLSLEVIARPSPRATVARTGTLSHQTLAVAGGVAGYEERESGAGVCSLVFKLEARRIRVSQSGLCAEFGVGIDATGTYTLQQAKS